MKVFIFYSFLSCTVVYYESTCKFASLEYSPVAFLCYVHHYQFLMVPVELVAITTPQPNSPGPPSIDKAYAEYAIGDYFAQ